MDFYMHWRHDRKMRKITAGTGNLEPCAGQEACVLPQRNYETGVSRV